MSIINPSSVYELARSGKSKKDALIKGYDINDQFDQVGIEKVNGRDVVVYPVGSIVKHANNCYFVEEYIGEGNHKVRSLDWSSRKHLPPEELHSDNIMGMTDEFCLLITSKDEVLFTDRFNQFKNMADEMLEDLTEEEITEFATGEDFPFYEKVIQNGMFIPYKERKLFVQIVDNLLEHLSEKEIEKFSKSKKFDVYEDAVTHYHIGGS